MAQLGRERALRVTATAQELPAHADGVITGVHRGLAVESSRPAIQMRLACSSCTAQRTFTCRPRCTGRLQPRSCSTICTRLARSRAHARARSCVFASRSTCAASASVAPLAGVAEHVLLLGNYHRGHSGRAELLRDAWADGDLLWKEAGGEAQTFDVSAAIAEADVVVGYGRSALEAMAGRTARLRARSRRLGGVDHAAVLRPHGGGRVRRGRGEAAARYGAAQCRPRGLPAGVGTGGTRSRADTPRRSRSRGGPRVPARTTGAGHAVRGALDDAGAGAAGRVAACGPS